MSKLLSQEGRAIVISVTPDARYHLWLTSLHINNNFSLQKKLTASACGTLWGSNESTRTKHVCTLILSQSLLEDV